MMVEEGWGKTIFKRRQCHKTMVNNIHAEIDFGHLKNQTTEVSFQTLGLDRSNYRSLKNHPGRQMAIS